MPNEEKTILLKSPGKISLFLSSKYGHVISTAILMLFYLGYFTANKADYDLWGYLSFGRLFWENKGFPYHDVFSYMPTKTIWVYHEWLTGVILFKVHQYTGMAGLQILRYSAGMIIIWLVYKCATERGSNYIAAFLVLLLAGSVIKTGFAPVRAQIFTYLFYVLSIYILEKSGKDEKFTRLWWLIPIQLIWCNMHGGFVAGLCITGLYLFGRTISSRNSWPLAKIMVFSAIATFINPYGIKYWEYIINAVFMYRPFVAEWFSVFAALKYKMFIGEITVFIILVFTSLMVILWYPKKDITAITILTITAFLGFIHIRHIIFFVLSFGIYMPVYFNALWKSFQDNREILNRWQRLRIPGLILFFLLFTYIMLSSIFTFLTGSPFDIKTPSKNNQGTYALYPVNAVNYIKTHKLKGNILTEFHWGEYIMWSCYPDCLVGMDGRYETVYSDQICNEYFNFYYGKTGWQSFLNKYPHDMIVIEPDSIAYKLIKTQSNWKIAFEDKGSALFIRK